MSHRSQGGSAVETRMGVLSALNAIFHVPILGDYIVYAYWYLILLLSPFVGLGIIVYDHLSGHIWT